MPGKRRGAPRGKTRGGSKPLPPKRGKARQPPKSIGFDWQAVQLATKRKGAKGGWAEVNRQAKAERVEQTKRRRSPYVFKNNKGKFRAQPKTPRPSKKLTSKRLLKEIERGRVPQPDITAVRRPGLEPSPKLKTRKFKYRYSWFFYGPMSQLQADELIQLLIRKTEKHPRLMTQAVAYLRVPGQKESVVLPSKLAYPQQTLSWLREFFNHKYMQQHIQMEGKEEEVEAADTSNIVFEVRAWSDTKVWP